MNTIFENECTYTYQVYLQLKRKTMDKTFVKTAYWVIAVLVLIMAFCMSKGWTVSLVFGLPVLALALYRLIGTPIRLAAFAHGKNREIHGGKDVVTVNNFYEDHVLAINALTKNKTNIPYVDVKKVLETKDTYILEMEQGLVLIMAKDGFKKGTKEDFVEFLKEKCVNAEVNL